MQHSTQNQTATTHSSPTQATPNARIPSMAAYRALCKEAEEDYEGYWKRHAQALLDWHKPFTQGLDASTPPFFRWFSDGKLNASYNCLDRHIKAGNGARTALIFENDSGEVTHVSYSDLLARVCRLANGLRNLGVRKGDRVAIYLPVSIEGVVAMQACARIGAIHTVIFGGFSAHALHDRIVDTQACVLITADGQFRGGKALPLKPTADEAIAKSFHNTVRSVVVVRQTGEETAMLAGRDVWYHDLVEQQPQTCEPEWVDAEHPLFLLYTSGSTGSPKGVQHSTGGYLLQATMSMQYTFDIRPQTDVFWCTADIGWITGHTYMAYGPLSCGATQLLFGGIPTWPDAGRFWDVIQRHRVTIFYTAPTAIRSLIKAIETAPQCHPRQYDLSSLRILGTVGEPINPAAWQWYHDEVGAGRCPVVDTFWQTETGAHMIAPMPGATPLVPGSCTLPFPGIQIAVVDETGNEVPHGQAGILVVRKPWPAMIRTIWRTPARFINGYYPDDFHGNLYLAGDGAIRDPDTGYFTITGRIDDTLNVSGHRMGTMEIESSLVAHDRVAEAAVVARPDDLTGEAVLAFVVLKGERPGDAAQADALTRDLQEWVSRDISPIARPKEIRFGDNLPKTRSGKIMRRLLRQIARGEEITQDTSTLDNPGILDQLRQSTV